MVDRDDSGLPSSTRVGRVCLTVASIDRVAPFYRDVVGMAVDRDGDVATLAAGDTPLVLLEEDTDAAERPREAAGLFHLAVRVPARGGLADVLGRLQEHGRLSGASNHLVSEALYTRDPEGNGVEVYCDRPRDEWPEERDGLLGMETLPLDLEDLSSAATGGDRLSPGTDVGHVHLEVADLQRAETFYGDTLGFTLRSRYGSAASFFAAGDYHHHVGLNVWNGRTEPARGSRGLSWFELVVQDDDALEAAVGRLHEHDATVDRDDSGRWTSDPDGIGLRLCADDALRT